jgi:hypothetical protein
MTWIVYLVRGIVFRIAAYKQRRQDRIDRENGVPEHRDA